MAKRSQRKRTKKAKAKAKKRSKKRVNPRKTFVPGVSRTFSPPELKFLDGSYFTALHAVHDSAVWTIPTQLESLNLIPKGTGPTERIGAQAYATSLELRIEGLNLIAAETADFGVLVYLDKQCNGATSTVTEVLVSNEESSFNNLYNRERFKILKRKQWHQATTSTGELTGYRSFKFHIPLNIMLNFNGTGAGGSIADTRSNNIGIMLFNNDQTHTNYEVRWRLRFRDS